MNPQSANTVHGFQGGYPTRPGFHDSHTGVSSLVHLPSPPIYGQLPGPYGPVTVANPPPTWNPTVYQAPKPTSDLTKWTSCVNISQSVSNLVAHTAGKTNATILELENLVLQSVSGGTNMRQSASRLLDEVITLMDLGSFCGKENELMAACALPFRPDTRKRYRWTHGPVEKKSSSPVDYFSKVYLYSNSRMPPRLPHIKFYPATYPLLRLAARYSLQVYEKPQGPERQSYVNSDWRRGTKAMVIKSLPIDKMGTIVFAIRGTQSFSDWAVNVYSAPVSTAGFLDDPLNKCHAGFLSVAKKMVPAVAARLRTLIEEDPSRMSYTLLITGHSAGGAVASLIYLHLLSESPKAKSELTHLRGCFKNIHCVTFGAPPISLRPLQRPSSTNPSKSMFFSFVNEGDPVTRADKDYFFSLLDLYASPTPGSVWSLFDPRGKRHPSPYWKVPRSTLSIAGRIVLLRSNDQLYGRLAKKPSMGPDKPPPLPPREQVEACGTTDLDLRGVVFGDPLMHSMDIYARRIEALANGATKREFH
ncbi:uncharacterized protein N7469_001081 [Penicillium citrinum]|uniref:Fungal lipase-type domain-containing protein n=1 Tax=Penicillium citrinum TaxID=5077 RepID=A0A9W9TW06_PENCI|nr:uncharacterized protein N7469_001081 [Penicillium citrinum]KAJ5242754.1 hypothetical protein N7469_001081 [Penicillium citrinum]